MAALLSLGQGAPVGFVQTAEAGQKRHMKGPGIKHRKMSGHRTMRSSGKSRHTLSRPYAGRSHTYIKRRSLVTGRHRGHGSIRYVDRGRYGKYDASTIKRRYARHHDYRKGGYKHAHVHKGGKRKHDVDVRRSGVTHIGSRSMGHKRGWHEVAGHTTIIKRRMHAGLKHGHRKYARYHLDGSLIVLGVETATNTGMAPIAGSDGACDYGTYCTINLGGPKIITFNDVADYRGDAPIDEGEVEGLGKEDYLEK